jgi:hypothetical protein
MHTLGLFAVCLGALTLFGFGVLSVWRDLIQVTHGAPLLIEDDGLAWSSRYRGAANAEAGVAPDGRMVSRH